MTFRLAFQRNTGVVTALLAREALQRRLNPMEGLFALMEPIFMISVISFGFWFFSRFSPYGTSTFLFLATGFFPYYFFIYIGRRMRSNLASPRRRFPIEQTLDHIFAHLVLRVIDYTILGILLFSTLFLLVTPEALPTSMIPIVEAGIAIVAIGFGMGTINMTMGQIFPVWQYCYPALERIMVFFTGIHLVIDFLPPPTRYILSLNPMEQAVHLFRTGFYPQFPRITLDPAYLTQCAIALVFLGLIVERATRRYIKK